MDIVEKISSARKIWLSTHKNADGDGLGSEIAFYYALQKRGKAVQIVHNDPAPLRYHFLTEGLDIVLAQPGLEMGPDDLAVIFDTHEPSLCTPLFELLEERKTPLLFVDHHVPTKTRETASSSIISYLINERASCTGEIVFELIQKLDVAIDTKMATALYASLIFDTQNFKQIRGSSRPYKMAAELIECGANHELIQKNIFDNWTANKMNFLARLIQNTDYRQNQKIALIKIYNQNLFDYQLKSDDVSDFIDLFMSIQSLEVAVVIREESAGQFRLSFRGRSQEVLSWAQSFKGGGHLLSAGAWIHETEENIILRLEALIAERYPARLSG